MRLLSLLLLVLTAGCSAARPKSVPTAPPDEIVLSHNLGDGLAWHDVAEKALGKPTTVVLCHGGYDAQGTWTLFADDGDLCVPVCTLAKTLKAALPGREIVLISCNPRGHELHVPGVYYAKNIVWNTPGTNKRFCLREMKVEEYVGHFSEFVKEP